MEELALIILGIVLIFMGISHRKGNISTLHSYHTKRVLPEDRIPFGKMVGLGVIIAGISLILTGSFFIASNVLQKSVFFIIGNIVLIGGLVIGVGISLYAIIKFNKGIF